MHAPNVLILSLLLPLGALAGCVSDDDAASGAADDAARARGGPGLTPYIANLAIVNTPAGNFTKVLCDGGVCLRQLTTLDTGPANEVMLAVDATDPSQLLAGSKDYHADNPTCVVVSVYYSRDAGRTWVDGFPRPTTGVMGGPSTDRCESDPATTFDGRGNAFVITLDTGLGLFTYRTADQGRTWQEVAMAWEGGNDKNWVATDYRTGRIYSITRATNCGDETVTVSDDSGASWHGPYCFEGMDFAQIDVGPEGNVYAIGGGQGGVAFAKSVNGGLNWSQASLVAPTSGVQTLPVLSGHPYRTPNLPDMAVALGTGAIYTVWHGADALGDEDVFFAASFDQGASWTEPVVVPDGPGDQFIPAVAASPNGDAHVIFFDARNDPSGSGHLLDVYYAHGKPEVAEDGSVSIAFEPNIRLTPESFVPYLSRHQQQPFFIGDYIGLVATNNEATGVFPVTVNGRAEIHSAIVGG